jgi:hypothetical protein
MVPRPPPLTSGRATGPSGQRAYQRAPRQKEAAALVPPCTRPCMPIILRRHCPACLNHLSNSSRPAGGRSAWVASPRKRLVKICTKRLRGNVAGVAARMAVIHALCAIGGRSGHSVQGRQCINIRPGRLSIRTNRASALITDPPTRRSGRNGSWRRMAGAVARRIDMCGSGWVGRVADFCCHLVNHGSPDQPPYFPGMPCEIG